MEQLSIDFKEELFETITSLDQLRLAYKAVRENRGVPGVDDVSVESFGENLEGELRTLRKELKEWTYKPKPVKRARIPKAGSKQVRLLWGCPV